MLASLTNASSKASKGKRACNQGTHCCVLQQQPARTLAHSTHPRSCRQLFLLIHQKLCFASTDTYKPYRSRVSSTKPCFLYQHAWQQTTTQRRSQSLGTWHACTHTQLPPTRHSFCAPVHGPCAAQQCGDAKLHRRAPRCWVTEAHPTTKLICMRHAKLTDGLV